LAWLSDGYPGSISDKVITEVSGFIQDCVKELLIIIADKGFDGACSLIQANKGQYMQPTKKRVGIEQLSAEDNERTSVIANARIHVERAFAALKHFHFLDNIGNLQYNLASKAVKAAAFVVNANNPPFKHSTSSTKTNLLLWVTPLIPLQRELSTSRNYLPYETQTLDSKH
jgi:hypothetical protein